MASRLLSDLSPAAAAKAGAFLTEANKGLAPKGLRVVVTCTYRSQEEQDALYAQGRTKAGRVVTRAKRSKHTQRVAWDVAFRVIATGKVTWDGPWPILGKIARDLGIEWGGSWAGWKDRCHFQVAE